MKKVLILILMFISINSLKIFAQDGINDWADSNFAFRDTISNTQPRDTVSRFYLSTANIIPAKYWFQGIFTATDTLLISTSPSFATNKTWILYPDEIWVTEKFNVNQRNLYYKCYFTGGHTGTAIVRGRVWYK